MKTYGTTRHDRGCCPGHDNVPSEKYSSRRSTKAHRRDTKRAHRRGRHATHQQLKVLLMEAGYAPDVAATLALENL